MRNSLCGFASGDLLVMDFRLAYASATDPEEIRRKDPTFAVRRHSCAVPGSYGVDLRAQVHSDSGERQFSVYYSRRYEPQQLMNALRREGWETVETWEYGGESNPCLLVLLRKMN